MTEAEWLTCADPQKMLEFLRGKVSDRKGNLFVCAMCRFNWALLYDESSKKNVEVVERYIDGQATKDECQDARYGAECPTFGYDFRPVVWRKWSESGEIPDTVKKLMEMGVFSEKDLQEDEPVVDPVVQSRLLAAADLAYHVGGQEPLEHHCLFDNLSHLDGPAASILRCIFGNLFRPVAFNPYWLTSTVTQLAEAIYQERAFDRLPILADALIDAGCNNEEILSHCRSGKEHCRGCWVVDLVTGRE